MALPFELMLSNSNGSAILSFGKKILSSVVRLHRILRSENTQRQYQTRHFILLVAKTDQLLFKANLMPLPETFRRIVCFTGF
jgi:hypothetical protein